MQSYPPLIRGWVGSGFNSLQTGKGMQSTNNNKGVCHPPKFQFPSNGKGHAKVHDEKFDTGISAEVSIPFKRERACKVIDVNTTALPTISFNSLQTGKGMQSNEIGAVETAGDNLFQFPSNGKGHAKSFKLKLI